MGFADDSFEVPNKPGAYLKLKKGDNRVRVLGDPIVGNEGWTAKVGGKPVRKRVNVAWQVDEVHDPNTIKRFFAVAVWDYDEKRVKVMHLTQSSIQKALRTLAKDEDWGEPNAYDLVITRSGEGMETEYSVTPKPKKPLDPAISAAWANVQKDGFDLSRLFDNGNPFGDTATVAGGGDEAFNAEVTGAHGWAPPIATDADIPF